MGCRSRPDHPIRKGRKPIQGATVTESMDFPKGLYGRIEAPDRTVCQHTGTVMELTGQEEEAEK